MKMKSNEAWIIVDKGSIRRFHLHTLAPSRKDAITHFVDHAQETYGNIKLTWSYLSKNYKAIKVMLVPMVAHGPQDFVGLPQFQEFAREILAGIPK